MMIERRGESRRSCVSSAGQQRQQSKSSGTRVSMRVPEQNQQQQQLHRAPPEATEACGVHAPTFSSRIGSSNSDDESSSAAMAHGRFVRGGGVRVGGDSAGWREVSLEKKDVNKQMTTMVAADRVKWLCSLHHNSVANVFYRRQRMKVLYTVLCFLVFKDLGVIVTCSNVNNTDREYDDVGSFNINATAGSLSAASSLSSSSEAFLEDYNSVEDAEGVRHYTAMWAVHIPGGEAVADAVARKHGFVNYGRIFGDYYDFHHQRLKKRSTEPSLHHQGRLDKDHRVREAIQQVAKRRQKRDYQRTYTYELNDPRWQQMWYLNRGSGLDMNVIPAWRSGITGKGIVVTILDDGLEKDHPDLMHNYDPKASYDMNSQDDDPQPFYDIIDSNRHGTRCAGEVAATANNSLCAVGIAYGARVGGVRMLDGDVTDAVEARSLSLNPQHIDIYSASWGPDDDGKTVDGPGGLATMAFLEGVTMGRGGKGSIFIWASGNGGRERDNCNCDGYTNSIWTLSISSATEEGSVPWYSEKCSSTLATTYSSGGQGEKQIVTTDLHHACTASHTGTSASAPLAAGIAALVLEANPQLTWRDLQHIVVRTAKRGKLDDPTWSKNGVGRMVSHSFGYGLMDAMAMVALARKWVTVPEQQKCEINAPQLDKAIPQNSHVILQLNVEHCRGVNYLEHVQAYITLTTQRRGDIQIYLTSPAGTRVTLLTTRIHDISRSGFTSWPFMSVHTWGEAPQGNWLLEIRNEGKFMAQIREWSLILHGTEPPAQPTDEKKINDDFGNSIEAERSSDRWMNQEQVDGDSGKFQGPTDSTDHACLDYAPNKFCIGLSLLICLIAYTIRNANNSHR